MFEHTQKRFDDVALWREHGGQVSGGPIEAGRYVNEEAPEEVLCEFLAFVVA